MRDDWEKRERERGGRKECDRRGKVPGCTGNHRGWKTGTKQELERTRELRGREKEDERRDRRPHTEAAIEINCSH